MGFVFIKGKQSKHHLTAPPYQDQGCTKLATKTPSNVLQKTMKIASAWSGNNFAKVISLSEVDTIIQTAL